MPSSQRAPDSSSPSASHGSTISSSASSSTITSDGSCCSSVTDPECRTALPQCQLSPLSPRPFQLPDAADHKRSTAPLQVDQHCYSESKLLSPSPGRASNRTGEPTGNQAVKKSIALMKLRRQGQSCTHASPGASGPSSCSINQAAAARELVASLERLSMADKAMPTSDFESDGEVQRSLLGESYNAEEIGVSRGGMHELPLRAKIAAAMDAEGRIGVQQEIQGTLQSIHRQQQHIQKRSGISPASCDNPTMLKKMTKKKKKKKKFSPGGGSGCRGRWIMRRRLRSARALLGKIWRNLRRAFSSSTKWHVKKEIAISTSRH